MMHAPGRHCCSTALTTMALAVALLLFASPRTVAAQLDELATTTCRGIAAPTEPIAWDPGQPDIAGCSVRGLREYRAETATATCWSMVP